MTTTLKNKLFSVTGATSGTFTFTSQGNVSFSNQSGSVPSDGNIYTDIIFFDLDAYSYPITLLVKLNDECSQTYVYTPVNPCSDLTLNVSQDDLQFTANVSGGTPGYTYTWTYDTTLFKSTVTNQRVLSLQLKDDVIIPPESNVRIEVADKNGCTTSSLYEFGINGPTLLVQSKNGTCLADTTTTTSGIVADKFVTFTVTDANGGNINNSTIDVSYDTSKHHVSVTNNVITVFSAETGSDSISVTVRNDLGIISNSATYTVNWPTCSTITDDAPVIAEEIIPATGDFEFDLGEVANAITDFDSFDFVQSSGQTKVSSTELTGAGGTYKLEGTKLVYTEGAGISTPENVRFLVSNTQGTVTKAFTVVPNFESFAAPVLADGTVCTSCDNPADQISIVPLITGDYDLSTLEVVSQGTNTTVSINPNYTLRFTETNVFDSVDTCTVRVKNNSGVWSNTATIHILRRCAGKVDTTTNRTCLTKAFNLGDIVTAASTWYATGGTTWAEITTTSNDYEDQGGTIGAGYTGAVDFTGINDGTYLFKLQTSVGCSAVGGSTLLNSNIESDSTVTAIQGTEETITIDSLASVSLGGGSTQITVGFTITDYTSLNNLEILEDGALQTITSRSVNSSGVGTATYTSTGTGTVTVLIRMQSKCLSTINDTDTIAI